MDKYLFLDVDGVIATPESITEDRLWGLVLHQERSIRLQQHHFLRKEPRRSRDQEPMVLATEKISKSQGPEILGKTGRLQYHTVRKIGKNIMKGKWISFLALNKFNFGGRTVYQFVLFECKFLFSVIFFYFVKSDKKQDRYHTHAFNALSFKLFGSYNEYVLLNEETGESECKERTEFVKFFPRDSYHLIGESKRGCVTLLLSGPWKPTWKEWISGEVTHYNWNRTIVNKS